MNFLNILCFSLSIISQNHNLVGSAFVPFIGLANSFTHMTPIFKINTR